MLSQNSFGRYHFLLLKAVTHYGQIVFRQTANYFLLEVVASSRSGAAVALLERRTTLFNVFFQAIVEILVAAAFVASTIWGAMNVGVEIEVMDGVFDEIERWLILSSAKN